MFCEFGNEKKLHTILVLVIALSLVTEVSAWEWLNTWSHEVNSWISGALSYTENLLYMVVRGIKNRLPPIRRQPEHPLVVAVTQAAQESDEEITTPRFFRRFGPFILDPDHPPDDEESFTT